MITKTDVYETARSQGLLGVWLICALKYGTHKPAPGPCLCGAPYQPKRG